MGMLQYTKDIGYTPQPEYTLLEQDNIPLNHLTLLTCLVLGKNHWLQTAMDNIELSGHILCISVIYVDYIAI